MHGQKHLVQNIFSVRLKKDSHTCLELHTRVIKWWQNMYLLTNYSFIFLHRPTLDDLLQSCLQCLIGHRGSSSVYISLSLFMTSVESLLMSVCGALRELALKISLLSKLLPRLNESYSVATGDRARIRTAAEPQSAERRRGGEAPEHDILLTSISERFILIFKWKCSIKSLTWTFSVRFQPGLFLNVRSVINEQFAELK